MEHFKKLCNEYGDAHRILAQIMIKQKLIPEYCLGQLFLEICRMNTKVGISDLKPLHNAEIVDLLKKTMNATLSLVGARMVVVSDELRRNTNYVSLVSDRNFLPSLSLINGFSLDELAVFRFWLGMMFNPKQDATIDGDEHIGEVSIHKACYCQSDMSTNLRMKLMNKMQNRQWIVLDRKRNVLRLHTCAIAELATSIQADYDLPICDLCQDVIILRRLSDQCLCHNHFHIRCLWKHIRDRNQVKCPIEGCQENFTRESLEKYDDEFEANLAPSIPFAALQSRKRKAVVQELNGHPKRKSVSGSLVSLPENDGEESSSISGASIVLSEEIRNRATGSAAYQVAASQENDVISSDDGSERSDEESSANDDEDVNDSDDGMEYGADDDE